MTIDRDTYAGLAADVLEPQRDQPPLVLLHGLTFDRSTWRPVLRELELLGRGAIAFDLPGHGQSLDLDSYRLSSVVPRIHAAIEAAGLREPVLVGHSVSAVIATAYAAVHRTGGVVNVAQSLYVTPFASFIQAHADEIQGPGFCDVWRELSATMDAHLLPSEAQRMLAAASRPRQEVAAGYWSDLLAHTIADLAVWSAGRLGAVRAARVPYRLIVGSEPDPEYRRWLGSQLPHASLTVLPRSGHFPQVAHPRRFARSLLDFTDRARASSPDLDRAGAVI